MCCFSLATLEGKYWVYFKMIVLGAYVIILCSIFEDTSTFYVEKGKDCKDMKLQAKGESKKVTTYFSSPPFLKGWVK